MFTSNSFWSSRQYGYQSHSNNNYYSNPHIQHSDKHHWWRYLGERLWERPYALYSLRKCWQAIAYGVEDSDDTNHTVTTTIAIPIFNTPTSTADDATLEKDEDGTILLSTFCNGTNRANWKPYFIPWKNPWVLRARQAQLCWEDWKVFQTNIGVSTFLIKYSYV